MGYQDNEVGFAFQFSDVSLQIDFFIAHFDAGYHFGGRRVIESKLAVYSYDPEPNSVDTPDNVGAVPMKFIGASKEDIAIQKREFSSSELLDGILPTVIELVVADANRIETKVIHRVDHSFALCQRTNIRAGKKISGVKKDSVWICGFFAFDESGNVYKSADFAGLIDPRHDVRLKMRMKVVGIENCKGLPRRIRSKQEKNRG
jgi:hypothetical protein